MIKLPAAFSSAAFLLGAACALMGPSGFSPNAVAQGSSQAQTAVDADGRPADELSISARDFDLDGSGYYLDRGGRWAAVNPEERQMGKADASFPYPTGVYEVALHAVGENDGQSSYKVWINGDLLGEYTVPLATESMIEGDKYIKMFKARSVNPGDVVTVQATIGTDGQEYSRARWARLVFLPADAATQTTVEPTRAALVKHRTQAQQGAAAGDASPSIPARPDKITLHGERGEDGDGSIAMTGEMSAWHNVTLNLEGPFANEQDVKPNAFTDYRMTVRFTHESGSPSYDIPGYFAADGDAAESSAQSGNVWRAHLSPDKPGKWAYEVSFVLGDWAAVEGGGEKVAAYDGKKGSFTISPSDKTGRDFRSEGRLQYVGKHHLRFAQSGRYFFKAGADAPETLLAYKEFDGTRANKGVPLKSYSKHIQDWSADDPTWQDGKGKGLIGAVNYMAGTGANVMSFLPYNAGGDGDNIWPFIERDSKFHYDCSKLDQWGIVFTHMQHKGIYLHFKLQETEIDDNRRGKKHTGDVPTSLDGGKLGVERKLYLREIIARYGHHLALNWNMGEENTQTPEEQRDMINYVKEICPYQHVRVIHSYPNQQDKVYYPLLGKQSELTGASLQNMWNQVHQRTLKWVTESAKNGVPWVVANDEQGNAQQGAVPDTGYQGFDPEEVGYSSDDVRKLTLWGNLMAGGAGVEYYFGYKLPENDLIAEDFRSRANSWRDAGIAIQFLQVHEVPFQDMTTRNALIGNTKNDNSKFCLAIEGEYYLVYLPNGGTTDLDLSGVDGLFNVKWFNPRNPGTVDRLFDGTVGTIRAGEKVSIGKAPRAEHQDWLALIRR